MNNQTHKSILQESIVNESPADFQKAMMEMMRASLTSKLSTTLQEEEIQVDKTMEILNASKSFGGECQDGHNGVLVVDFSSKQGAVHFMQYLENDPAVETFEVNASLNNMTYHTDTPVDFDSITDDRGYTFEVVAYLYPEFVSFDSDYDQDGDVDADDEELEFDAAEELGVQESVNDDSRDLNEEQLDEAIRKIRINSRGMKTIKMRCQPGFKWNHHIEACVKITGAQLAVMRKATRKALITKKSEGAGLKIRMARRIRRAMRFRKMMGLKT